MVSMSMESDFLGMTLSVCSSFSVFGACHYVQQVLGCWASLSWVVSILEFIIFTVARCFLGLGRDVPVSDIAIW